MHDAAYKWIEHHTSKLPAFGSVVEIGSLDINGSIRPLFGDADYIGLDPQDGPGVDWVGDAAEYEPPSPVDCVVCCEVLEHAANWRELVRKGVGWLGDDGVMLVTCAGPGRRPHSCVDGGYELRDWEHYENVSPAELSKALLEDFVLESTVSLGVQVRGVGQDTQAIVFRHGS